MKNKLLILFFTYVAAGTITMMVEESVLFKNIPAYTDAGRADASSTFFDTDFNLPGTNSCGFTGTLPVSASNTLQKFEKYKPPGVEYAGNHLPLYLLFHNFRFYDIG
ncbi:MAG: hypothetical protein ACE5FF_06055 [Saprospiraceae bacterium]